MGAEPIKQRCGKCRGCIITRKLDYAKCVADELDQADRSAMLTLTYHDDHLPKGSNIDPKARRKFSDRYRRRFGVAPRMLWLSEYTPTSGRPHYHPLIMDHGLADLELAPDGIHYTSVTLSRLWPEGFYTISLAHEGTAAYLADHNVSKQLTTEDDEGRFLVPQVLKHPTTNRRYRTGVVFEREVPESLSHLRPMVGYKKLELDGPDLYLGPNPERRALPRRYFEYWKRKRPELAARYLRERANAADQAAKDTPDSLIRDYEAQLASGLADLDQAESLSYRAAEGAL